MAGYNWNELKKEFILGDYKSLKDFADKKGLNYNATFRKRASGWLNEKRQKNDNKTTKIIERTIERQIEQEVDYNTTHLKLWDEFLNILIEGLKDGSIKYENGKINAYKLEKFANVMEKAQKGQRLALGLDENKETDDGSIESLIDAIKRARDKE